MRATMQVLNRVYLVEETRTFRQRLLQSITLSIIVTVLLLLAALAVKLGPIAAHGAFGDGVLVTVLSFLAAWGVGIAILFVVVSLVGRYAPDTRRPVRWVSFGGLVVITAWIVTSLLYGAYISHVADYSSIFGSLAVVMVTMSYIYLSAIVFLTGLQLDSLIRNKVDIRHEPDEGDAGPTLFIAHSATGPAVPHEVK
jgi:membrane protein